MSLVCFWLVFGEDLVGGLGPGEWVAALVPAVDEGADLGVEVLDGGEDSSADGRTVDDGEEDLDHVEPGGAGGGEVDVDARVGLQPGAHLRGLVGRSCPSPGAARRQGRRARPDAGRRAARYCGGGACRRL